MKFVIQMHAVTRLHFDLRLEIGDVFVQEIIKDLKIKNDVNQWSYGGRPMVPSPSWPAL